MAASMPNFRAEAHLDQTPLGAGNFGYTHGYVNNEAAVSISQTRFVIRRGLIPRGQRWERISFSSSSDSIAGFPRWPRSICI